MERVIRRNIIKLYTMAFFEAVMVITAVFVPLLQRHGLSMAEVMQTQAMFAFVVASCEVPSGVTWPICGAGRTPLFLERRCARSGSAGLSSPTALLIFLLMEFLLGVGMSLNSGADLALLYDSQNYLSRNGQPNKTTKLIARLVSMESLAAGLAGVATGILALWSLDLVVYAQALICLVPVGIALTLVEAPRVISVGSHAENALRIREAIIGQPLIPGIGSDPGNGGRCRHARFLAVSAILERPRDTGGLVRLYLGLPLRGCLNRRPFFELGRRPARFEEVTGPDRGGHIDGFCRHGARGTVGGACVSGSRSGCREG